MSSRSGKFVGKSGLSRRKFLHLAGLGLGFAAIGVAPKALFGSPALQTVSAQAARTGTLRVGWTSPVSSDPAKFADAPDESIGSALYNRLFTLDPKSQLVPSLAKSSSISADGLTITLTLQSGVKFHDGSAFSADDVKFTIQRLQDKATGSGAASLFTSVTAIDVVDPTTIKFTLSQPDATFLYNLSDYHVFILKNGTKDPTKELNGTGPFKTTADQIDFTTKATFTANENYWEPDLPKIAKLEMTFSDTTAHLLPALQGGQLDLVARLSYQNFQDVKADPNLDGTVITVNQFSQVRLRADRKPGSDPNVRKAFRLAIDRAELNQVGFNGLATPGRDSPIGPNYGALYTEATPLPARDAAAAKKLISDAGYPDGLKIDFYYPQGEEGSDDLVARLQAQLAEGGIIVNPIGVTSKIYYGDGDNNWLGADLAVTFWAYRPDPQPYLDLAYHSPQGTDLGKWNESHFADPELDKQIDAARVETDPKKRAAEMAEIQRILIERGPVYIPYFQPLFLASSKKVSGIVPASDVGLTSFASATIAS